MTIFRTFDTAIAGLISRLPAVFNRPFALVGLLTSPLAWALYICIAIAFRQTDGLQSSLIILMSIPLATAIKFLFRRQRPPTIYAGNMLIKSYSFPSSHSYASAVGGVYFAQLAWSAGLQPLALVLCIIPVVVATSRVYLGAHYPSDVLAGLILGATVTTGVTAWL